MKTDPPRATGSIDAIPHRFPGPLISATLVAREKQFIARATLKDGSEVVAHLPDRGRLQNIVEPGRTIYLAHTPGPKRRTAFTVLCALCPPIRTGAEGYLCSLDPAGANRLAHALLQDGQLEGLDHTTIRREVKHGHSRIDIVVGSGTTETLVEVKSTVATHGDAACFPDAPSVRASRHVALLTDHVREGGRAAIVLVAQRGDVRAIRPHAVDPVFEDTLRAAREHGVRVFGVRFDIRLDGAYYTGQIPVMDSSPGPAG